MANIKQKALSLLLALSMMLSMLPAGALAAWDDETDPRGVELSAAELYESLVEVYEEEEESFDFPAEQLFSLPGHEGMSQITLSSDEKDIVIWEEDLDTMTDEDIHPIRVTEDGIWLVTLAEAGEDEDANEADEFEEPEDADEADEFEEPEDADEADEFEEPEDADEADEFEEPEDIDEAEIIDEPEDIDEPEVIDEPEEITEPEEILTPITVWALYEGDADDGIELLSISGETTVEVGKSITLWCDKNESSYGHSHRWYATQKETGSYAEYTGEVRLETNGNRVTVTGVKAGKVRVYCGEYGYYNAKEITVTGGASSNSYTTTITNNSGEGVDAIAYYYNNTSETWVALDSDNNVYSFTNQDAGGKRYIVFFVKANEDDGYLLKDLAFTNGGHMYSVAAVARSESSTISGYPSIESLASENSSYTAMFGWSKADNEGDFTGSFKIGAVKPQPRLLVTKTSPAGDAYPGDTVTFTVRIEDLNTVGATSAEPTMTGMTINGQNTTTYTTNSDGTYTVTYVVPAENDGSVTVEASMNVAYSLIYHHVHGNETVDITSNTAIPVTAEGSCIIADLKSATYVWDETTGAPDSVSLPEGQTGLKKGDTVTVAEISQTPVEDAENHCTWTFDGWYLNGEKVETGSTVTVGDSNLLFVGKWNKTLYKYTVTYTDGVDNEEVFEDQTASNLVYGDSTPAFSGTLTREGYTFTGWTPEVSATVMGNATYTAQWEQSVGSYTVEYYLDGVKMEGTTPYKGAPMGGTAAIGSAVELTGLEDQVTVNERTYALDRSTKIESISATASQNVIQVYYCTDEIGTTDPEGPDGTPDKYQVEVTFKVENGSWNDETITDVVKVVTLKDNEGNNSENGSATLAGVTIPMAGEKPQGENYMAGGWDTTPTAETVITKTGTKTFTYTYVEKAEMAATAESYKGVYDGQSHGITVTVKDKMTNEAITDASIAYYSDEGCTQELTNSFKDVTNTTVYYKVEKAGYKTVTGSATVEITKAELTVQADNKSKVYDGNVFSGYTYTITGFVNGEDSNVVTGSVTYGGNSQTAVNAGSYTITPVISGLSATNYTFKAENGTLIINKKGINQDNLTELGIGLTADSKVYDGTATVVDGDGDGEAYTITAPEGVTITAGSVLFADANAADDKTVTASGLSLSGEKANNYELATGLTLTTTADITPKSVTIVVDSKSKNYSASDPAFTGTVDGVVADDDLYVSYARADGDSSKENVGDDITITATYVEDNNYNVTVTNGKLIILATNENGVNVTGYTGTYDGQNHSVNASALKEGSTLLYSKDGGTTFTSDLPEFKDAGTYTVYVKATNPNFEETAVVQAKVEITPVGLIIETPSDSKVYDGEALTKAGTITGLVGDEATFTTTGSQTKIGSSQNTYSLEWKAGTVRSNYYIASETLGTLTVTAADVSVVKMADQEKVVLGETITWTITVTNESDVAAKGLSLSDSIPGAVLNGENLDPASFEIPANDSVTFKASYTPTEAGTCGNTVVVKQDGTPVDEDTADGVTVEEQNPAVTIIKTITAVNGEAYNGGKVNVGDVITYQVVTTNTGNVALSDVTINDSLAGTHTIAALAKGAADTWTYTYTVPAGSEGQTITNTAVAAGETIEDNGGGEVEIPVNRPGLNVTKTVSATRANVGDTITYTILVRNTGEVTLTDIVIHDPMMGEDVTIDSLPVGGTWNSVYTHVVTEAEAGTTIHNEVTVNGQNGPVPVVDTDDTDTVITDRHTLTASIDRGTISGAGRYDDGNTATVTFNVSRNYYITGVTVDGEEVSYVWDREAGAYQLTVLMDGDHDVVVSTAYDDEDDDDTPTRPTRPDDDDDDNPGRDDGDGDDNTTILDEDVPLAGDAQLNDIDHFAYIKGYEDGTVRPMGNITREEVATIFYRLLTDTSRAIYFTEENSFSDVDSSRWSNKAISTLTNAGVLTGYPDGTFQPGKTITRAEFAAIAARFSVVTEAVENPFRDTTGHWAEQLISFAASKGWVTGYPDGTYLPEQAITRAEAMTLINRVLNRAVDQEGLLADAKQWIDNPEGEWYYFAVLEATNSHDYERRVTSEVMENWTALTADRVWDE